MKLEHPVASWVIVMGNIQAESRIRCIGQQLDNYDNRAQLVHPGFLVVGQTKIKHKKKLVISDRVAGGEITYFNRSPLKVF